MGAKRLEFNFQLFGFNRVEDIMKACNEFGLDEFMKDKLKANSEEDKLEAQIL